MSTGDRGQDHNGADNKDSEFPEHPSFPEHGFGTPGRQTPAAASGEDAFSGFPAAHGSQQPAAREPPSGYSFHAQPEAQRSSMDYPAAPAGYVDQSAYPEPSPAIGYRPAGHPLPSQPTGYPQPDEFPAPVEPIDYPQARNFSTPATPSGFGTSNYPQSTGYPQPQDFPAAVRPSDYPEAKDLSVPAKPSGYGLPDFPASAQSTEHGLPEYPPLTEYGTSRPPMATQPSGRGPSEYPQSTGYSRPEGFPTAAQPAGYAQAPDFAAPVQPTTDGLPQPVQATPRASSDEFPMPSQPDYAPVEHAAPHPPAEYASSYFSPSALTTSYAPVAGHPIPFQSTDYSASSAMAPSHPAFSEYPPVYRRPAAQPSDLPFAEPPVMNLAEAGFVYTPFPPIGLDASKKRIRITVRMRGYKINRVIRILLLVFSIFIIIFSLLQIVSAILLPMLLGNTQYYDKYQSAWAFVGAGICLFLGILNVVSTFLVRRVGSFVVAFIDAICCFIVYGMYYKAYASCTINCSGYLGLAEPSVSIASLILCSFIFGVKGFQSPVPSMFRDNKVATGEVKVAPSEPEQEAKEANGDAEQIDKDLKEMHELAEPVSPDFENK